MLQWFELLIQWLESESGAELYTLTELHSKMTELSDGSGVYTIKRMKQCEEIQMISQLMMDPDANYCCILYDLSVDKLIEYNFC